MEFEQILHGVMQIKDDKMASSGKFFADLLRETKPLNAVDTPYMSNWLLVSERLSHDVKDYQIVLSMLAYELTHKQRSQIVERLVSRFVTIVKTQAHDNFAAYLKHCFTSQQMTHRGVWFDEKA